MNLPRILVVEDDTDLREALGETLGTSGFVVELAQDGRIALDILSKTDIDMVVTDIQMPRMDGHALLKHIKQRWPDMPVLLMTAYGTIQKAVQAMRDGAMDYLTKPFEAEVIVNMITHYLPAIEVDHDHQFIAEDEISRRMAETARRVANSDATVLICGESGTGKEVYARYIHEHSQRTDKPFIAINCAAIPDNMLEATLFGYEKGAFTGAYKSCPGKFELADGGTLLLDEISEMDLALQAKLLRVLQEREVERLGGNNLIKLDVRVLATSNRNMRVEVSKGRFREDLFYRLNVFPLMLAPLRDRPKDILAITSRLIQKHVGSEDVTVNQLPTLSDSAERALLTHKWQGNVRELDNVIQRALILRGSDEITQQDLQFEHDQSMDLSDRFKEEDSKNGVFKSSSELLKEDVDSSRPVALHMEDDQLVRLGDEMKNHEYSTILDALKNELGSRKAVAEKLGISQRTLRYKLAKMREQGINIPGRYAISAD